VLEGADHVERWMAAMASRPAVKKGMAVGSTP
jgi:glutathione S-transferase